MIKLPIGMSNFQKIRTQTDGQGRSYTIVDKSLLIRDIIDEDAAVILLALLPFCKK